MNEFTDEKLESIFKSIDKALTAVEKPVAAFDADGTLWSHDAGEQFFEFKQNQNLLETLPEDPWSHYANLKANVSKEAAYLWLAQIAAGVPIKTLREWAQNCLEMHAPTPIFDAQKQIISYLQDKGVDVYVVTASIKWAVEPGAALYNIPQENVIGITTQIKDGVITEEQDGPVTYREGKVKGLLEKTGGVSPFFTSGNSEGDLPLLEASSHLRLVMASADKETNPEMYEIEQSMITLAKQRNWFHHSYVD